MNLHMILWVVTTCLGLGGAATVAELSDGTPVQSAPEYVISAPVVPSDGLLTSSVVPTTTAATTTSHKASQSHTAHSHTAKRHHKLTVTTLPPKTTSTAKPPVASVKLGVGGASTADCGAENVTCLAGDAGLQTIASNNRVLDCRGHTVKKVVISANGVTVQNCFVKGAGNAGIYSLGTDNTIRNNDISGVDEGGEGDINAITFFGNGSKILYNNMHDVVRGDPGGSHTDCIQSWASESKVSSSNVQIIGNSCTGPDESNEAYVHQCVMAEGPPSQDGGGGAKGESRGWLVQGNRCKTYGNQAMKFDGINDVVISKNVFDGAASKVVATGKFSKNIDFRSDNVITGNYGSTVGD